MNRTSSKKYRKELKRINEIKNELAHKIESMVWK